MLIATGRYLGEGFDDARLDTLFLTMPISWRGTLAQYAGRLHRLREPKRDVIIFDYVDANEPMLAKIAGKREAGYRALGYKPIDRAELDRLLAPRSWPGPWVPSSKARPAKKLVQPKTRRWQAYREVIPASARLQPFATCIMKLYRHFNHIRVRSFVPPGPPVAYELLSLPTWSARQLL